MSGDDRFPNQDQSRPEDQTPASVIWMEMMRRAAADREAPPEVDRPPSHQEMAFAESDSTSSPPVDTLTLDALDTTPDQHAALEAQRIRRVERRRERRRRQTVGIMGGILRTLIVVVISGGLMATILSWWTTPDALDDGLRASLGQAVVTAEPTSAAIIIPTPNWLKRIGIVSGHRGPENDPGAVCPDGLTENEINYAVAERVVLELRRLGYSVDLLEEFDERLEDYRANALVSIHANDCRDYGEYVSGFLVSQAESRPQGGEDTRLMECLAEHYGRASQLEQRFGLTRDMTDYHIFRLINITTPGVILELGFMKDDRELLTTQPDVLAQGIVQGIICYIEGPPETPTPDPAAPAASGTETPVIVPTVSTTGG